MNYLDFNGMQEPEFCELNTETDYCDYISSLFRNKSYTIDSYSNYSYINHELPYLFFYEDGYFDESKVSSNEMYIINGIEYLNPIFVKLSPIGMILNKNGDFIGYNCCFTSLTSYDAEQIKKYVLRCY